ncbi:hypothetical protein, conserved [Plasmodium gonderi]|uniref:E2F-associated phosphoprotein n=1 Tax=Plasmodium gonderi TaxID=77519 RepID=A0A1Y1JG66_PLAGO|nr:hypothetical protein, conserved [Plasmodium gonderi]GAW79433.1 hypothetical protein, conserved [Plasmodium gonderi]
MNSKRVNNVINLLINEIKTNERSENAKELPKEKGINFAKSFLNINGSEPFCENSLQNKGGYRQWEGCAENVGIPKNNCNVNSQEKQKTNFDEENFDDDIIREEEKKALEFYDERIDIYEEEYVNKKYRFCTKNCDSSLCCCGCFIPVCYQSQRHESYVNQYRSLYAVNVRIDKKNIIHEHEINAETNCNIRRKAKSNPKSNARSNTDRDAYNNSSDNVPENPKDSHMDKMEKQTDQTTLMRVKKSENEKNGEEEKSQIYHAVFCVNCNNHIAYLEIKKNIFHFFDVLPD